VSRLGQLGRPARWAGWIALLAAIVAFYAWTTATSEPPNDPVGVENRLADALVHGQLNLRLQPPFGLLLLRDPYDFNESARFRQPPIADLAFYHRKLYAYWGPVPALLVFLPAHVVGIDHLSERWVTFGFCLGALVFAALMLWEALRRWLPRTPGWFQGLAFAVLAVGGGQLWLLRKPDVYQLAIAAGACFLGAGLYALLRGVRPGAVRPGLLALGSLAIGLAFGSRWSLAPALLIPAGLLVWLWRRTPAPERRRLAAALLGPMAACVALLAAYNWARFGSPFETGLRYTLVHFDFHFGSLFKSFSLHSVRYYFLEPIRFRAQFPYLWQDTATPRFFAYSEPVAGLLWTTPMLLALPLAIAALRRRRPVGIAVLIVTGLALVIFVQYLLYNFAAVRYMGDFGLLLVVAALAAVAAALDVVRRWGSRVTLVVVVAIAGAVSVVANVAVSVDGLARTRPATLASLASTFDWIPTAAASVAGHALLAGVDGRPVLPRRPSIVLSRHRIHYVDVVSPGSRPVSIAMRLTHVSGLAETALSVRGRSPVADSSTIPVADQVQHLIVPVRRGLNRIRLELVLNDPAVFPDARYALIDVLGVQTPR
jgi:hypothetical protein